MTGIRRRVLHKVITIHVRGQIQDMFQLQELEQQSVPVELDNVKLSHSFDTVDIREKRAIEPIGSRKWRQSSHEKSRKKSSWEKVFAFSENAIYCS